MAETWSHYISDTYWREGQLTWRVGTGAFVMSAVLAITMNLLRARSSRWTDDATMPRRSMAADYAFTAEPGTVPRKPP